MKITKEKDFSKIEYFLNSNFSSPTHWPDWNLVVAKFFSTEFFYFTVYENNELVGICPVHLDKKGLLKNYRSGQFHFIPFGGWIFARKIELNFDKLPIDSLSRFEMFGLPFLDQFNNQISQNKIVVKKTLIIDLADDLEKIWKEQIKSKRRNMIRKAEKNNVAIEINKYKLEEFYGIYKHASIRSNLSLLSIDFFFELFNTTKNIRFDIITAKKENKFLANSVVAYDKNYSIYWLGNYADNIPNLGQGELLQWETIKHMKEKGCHYYDLCYIEKERLPYIYKFKCGFSSNEVVIPLIIIKPFLYRILNRMLWRLR